MSNREFRSTLRKMQIVAIDQSRSHQQRLMDLQRILQESIDTLDGALMEVPLMADRQVNREPNGDILFA